MNSSKSMFDTVHFHLHISVYYLHILVDAFLHRTGCKISPIPAVLNTECDEKNILELYIDVK